MITDAFLKQNPDDPTQRILQVTYPYNSPDYVKGDSSNGVAQYTLTQQQFAQLANAGLKTEIGRTPNYYLKGDFNPVSLGDLNLPATDNLQFGNANVGITPEMRNLNKILQNYSTAPTTYTKDLATDTAARQNYLDYSMGGKYNILTPGATNGPGGSTYAPINNGATTSDPRALTPSGSQSAPTLGGSTQSAALGSTAGGGGGFTQFVKTPNDATVYGVTSNGQYVGFDSWDHLLAANGGKAPQIGTISSTPSSSINYNEYQAQNQSQGPSAEELGPYADLYKQMQDYLSQLQKNGQVINPNVQITPDQLAAFASQAATQIHPYYATQLAAATDSFLSNLGYNTDQFKNAVTQAQTQYGRNLDNLASSAADRGFALSGIRQKEEGQLASDTQNNLDQLRSSLFNSASNSARQFAQQFGGTNVPTAPTLGQAPRVLSGVSQFENGTPQGLYQLDPSIYGRLIGSEQNSEKQATDSLASQLATNANQLTANQQARTLL